MKEFLAMWLGGFLGKARDEEGQGLVEYALIIALVAILLIGALATLRGGIQNVFTTIAATLTGS